MSFLPLRDRLYSQKSEPRAGTRLDSMMGDNKIFDTFADEDGRNAHLSGRVAELLFARAKELFAEPPAVEMLEILASKSRND